MKTCFYLTFVTMKQIKQIQNISVTQDTINRLETLFEFASPESLRKSIHHVFFSFLINDKEILPNDFERISTDFYFLLDFLNNVQETEKEK